MNPPVPVRNEPENDAGARLTLLEQLAVRAGMAEVARDAEALARRVVEGRYYVACVGQFKRGKSTLLNALVGANVLPTGVTPVTSVVTLLRYGPKLAAVVRYAVGHEEPVDADELAAFVSEAENPGNAKGVTSVEVFVPCALLASGMCLADTPGLGSVFDANTATTHEFLPHIDAALVVIGADPPISGEELGLIEAAASNVDRVVLVLNKADRLPAADVAESARFAAKVVSERLRRPVGPVLEVSAIEALETGASRDWGRLEKTLATLARDAGADLVRAAEQRGVRRLGAAVLRELGERHDALVRPREEIAQRLVMLGRSAAAVSRAIDDLGVLLTSEQARLAREYRDRHGAYFPRAQERAARLLEDAVRSSPVPRRQLRAVTFERAREIARSQVEQFRHELEPAGEEMYRRSMERFVLLANEFLQRFRESGEPGLESLPEDVGTDVAVRAETRLHYTDILDQTMSPLGTALDLVRPRERVVKAVLRRVVPYLERLVETNGSRVANDLVERVTKSRAALEQELRAALRQVTNVAERALANADARRSQGEQAVTEELSRLAELRREVLLLLNESPQGGTP